MTPAPLFKGFPGFGLGIQGLARPHLEQALGEAQDHDARAAALAAQAVGDQVAAHAEPVRDHRAERGIGTIMLTAVSTMST